MWITPGSTSSFSRKALGSFIPFAHRIARRADGVEETMVPTRTYDVRVAAAPDFAFAEDRWDGIFIPCAGAKRLVHCSGGDGGTTRCAGSTAGRTAAFGA